ncbi:MAG: hypothetical protein CBC39_07300 [Cellvibrionales bacterium TMED79]|nr:hypothetical protein [Halieaceae bacterium]OUU99395.1 MAG: hypothetical protein CBC39_07300 [Cellvibrionales bacterium TMED79]
MMSKTVKIIQSTLAAAIGVQSKKNRERDFEEGNAGAFIAAGIIFTALFIATVLGVVQWVLA